MRQIYTCLAACVILSLLFFQSAYAQENITVRGTVSDAANNQTLIGVAVKIKGATRGTSTDMNGGFSLSAPSNGTLVISYIGYTTAEIPINNQTQLNIKLKPSSEELQEVVVIGYGTTKKADLTGSIGSVTSAQISRQPALNAVQSIQGKLSGINVVSSEAPGSAPNVIIRGLGTALGGRDPLYIVDGFPVDNIKNINSADILSMDVLKDASSASIYGVRAANGVILITTKKGKQGKAVVSFDSYYGVKSVLNRVKMANAQEYTEYYNENLASIGSAKWRLAANQPNNTDWYDELLRNGNVVNNVVSISGGNDNIDYFFSYNNFLEHGLMDGFKYNRNTIRNNNTYKLFNNKFRLTQNLNISFTNERPKPYGAFDNAYRQSPLVPVWYDNGRSGRGFVNQTTGIVDYKSNPGDVIGSLNSIGNPVYTANSYNQYNKTLTLQGGLNGEVDITKDLKFNSRLGVTKYYSNNRSFVSTRRNWLNVDPRRTEQEFVALRTANPGVVDWADNSLEMKDTETFRWIWENFVSYDKSFGKHHINATVGMSREKTNIGKAISALGYGVPEQEQYWNVDMASSNWAKVAAQNYYTPNALASYFARAQYNYANKYYLTATFRRDGSSIFKESGKYWGSFPSVGLGWTASNEDFLKDLKGLTFLKFRGSWGRLGNQNVPLNVSQVLTSPANAGNNYNYPFGPGQDLNFGAAFGSPALGLTWETTEEWSVGADFTLWNKLSGSVDWYHKKNKNAILEITPTLNSEFSDNYYDHGASISNKGLELSLNWDDRISKDLSYSIGINYAYNKNDVNSVKPAYDRAIGGSLANGQITKQLRANQPIYGWWMYDAVGVWQDQAEINANAHLDGARPGYLRYADTNGDGVIDERDKQFFGSYIPTSTYGIRLGLNYKRLDFSVDGYGVGGNRVYNALKGVRIDGGENIARDTYMNRWNGAGTSNVNPGADRDSFASSYYLESGSYFRINNITLGYTLENAFKTSSRLRVYATAQNPFMFTKYSGFTPEIGTDGDAASTGGKPNGTTGIELSAYPTTRNFIFGLNLSF